MLENVQNAKNDCLTENYQKMQNIICTIQFCMTSVKFL